MASLPSSASYIDKKVAFIDQLVKSNCLKFGEFKLKSGASSSYYIDLREATMHPHVFKTIVDLISETISDGKKQKEWNETTSGSNPVAIVGVPYGVVPVAAATAYSCKLSYYPVRKEVKEYGCKTEANTFSVFEHILIEDVMSSGSSILETIKKLDGKVITDVIVIVNRELGGEERLKAEFPTIKLHSILRVSEILAYYEKLKSDT